MSAGRRCAKVLFALMETAWQRFQSLYHPTDTLNSGSVLSSFAFNWSIMLLTESPVIAEVIGTFNGVLEISAEQREGIANYVLVVLPTGRGKSLPFQLLPGICCALNMMGYTSYPKKAIVLVICLLNALIESHMKELRQRSISCTCLWKQCRPRWRLQR